jgi:2-hydroxychromene-2-carboxylate isomerase
VPHPIDFFFDVASPYSYLASTRIDRLAAAVGAPVRWRPFLLGGVFKAVGNEPPATLAARAGWMLRDLHAWAERAGVPFAFSPSFPMNSLLPMRALAGLPDDALRPAAHRLFAATWAEGLDPSQPAVLAALLGEDALARAAAQDSKDRLRATTDAAIAAGAFGAPTFLVDGVLFFGNDRLDFVVEAAARGA